MGERLLEVRGERTQEYLKHAGLRHVVYAYRLKGSKLNTVLSASQWLTFKEDWAYDAWVDRNADCMDMIYAVHAL